MKAFHGDLAVKEKYLARLKAHHASDEIIQGTGWENGHGCAVGCTLNKYDHKAYENELGLPQWLAHLEDRIFEGLPAKDAQQFAVNFLETIPVGANVNKVRWQLASQRHTRDRDRLMSNPKPYAKQCVEALNLVIAYCDSKCKSESAAESARSAAESARSAAAAESAESEAWSAAESAAESARSAAWSAARSAWSAAWSAAESAAESARSARSAESAAWSAWSAWSAAESAAWSAWSAAWSAGSAGSAAESAWSNHFKWEAATLLELLRNAPGA